jgi:hypothetical protein
MLASYRDSHEYAFEIGAFYWMQGPNRPRPILFFIFSCLDSTHFVTLTPNLEPFSSPFVLMNCSQAHGDAYNASRG